MSLTSSTAAAIQKTNMCSKWKLLFAFTLVVVISSSQVNSAITEDNCEVCVKYLRKFVATLSEKTKKNSVEIENAFKDFCVEAVGKDERFCYYIGGARDSATYILNEMSKPISWSMPEEKICEKLSKMDSQICSLRYDKQIDLETVDLKKLKVRDLKKVLDNWGEVCSGCIEKDEFIRKIEELKPKYMHLEL